MNTHSLPALTTAALRANALLRIQVRGRGFHGMKRDARRVRSGGGTTSRNAAKVGTAVLLVWRGLPRLPGIFSARGGVVERRADALARHTVRMRSVVADRDEEPALTPVLAFAGEQQCVCVDGAVGARCRMSFRDGNALGAQLVREYLRTHGVVYAGIGDDGKLPAKVRAWG